MKKLFNNIPGGVKFLIIISFFYIIIFLFNKKFIINSLTSFTKEFISLLPMLLFFFFIIFLINYFLNPEFIKKHLGSNSGIKGWFYAILGSVFISSPPYIILPILKELKGYGMKYSLIAVFMNNRNVQPAFLPLMAYYFGLKFTIIISVYIMIFAIINAIIIGEIMEE